MNRIDQSLYLLDDIVQCYGKVLRYIFVCQRIYNFVGCKDLNCRVKLFIEVLIDNVKSRRLMEEKNDFFSRYCLWNEDICFSLLDIYVDRIFYVTLMDSFISHSDLFQIFCRRIHLKGKSNFWVYLVEKNIFTSWKSQNNCIRWCTIFCWPLKNYFDRTDVSLDEKRKFFMGQCISYSQVFEFSAK